MKDQSADSGAARPTSPTKKKALSTALRANLKRRKTAGKGSKKPISQPQHDSTESGNV